MTRKYSQPMAVALLLGALTAPHSLSAKSGKKFVNVSCTKFLTNLNPLSRPRRATVVSSFPGAQNLMANNIQYRSLRDAELDLPIDQHTFIDRKEIMVALGRGYWTVESAYLPSGEKVFIKTVRSREGVGLEPVLDVNGRRAERVLIEIQWAQIFYELGLGPKLHGVSHDSRGRPVLVYDFLDGTHMKVSDKFPIEDPRARAFAIEQLDRLEVLFLELGYSPRDLQFMVLPDGTMMVVDTELFLKWPVPMSWDWRRIKEIFKRPFIASKNPSKIIAGFRARILAESREP